MGILVADLGVRMQLNPLRCRLCRFLWDARMGCDTDNSDLESRYELRAFPCYWALPFIKLSAKVFPARHRRGQSSVLVVVPSTLSNQPSVMRRELHGSAIFRTTANSTPDHVAARVVGPSADLECVKEWMAFCTKNHGDSCPKPKQKRGTKVAGFRLIDCETKEVVKASITTDFAALSYVWGAPSEAVSSTSWPKTVEDAVMVTKQLGLRYLWVDRYCIDQENAAEKHEQISKMDIIYRQSQVTIIIAAGNGATYGIPGVSRPRPSPAGIRIGDLEMATVPEDPCRSIQASTWWKRGWTYQEGVLSRRRVVFTEGSVYYECGGMIAHEAYQLPPGNFHTKPLLNQESFIYGGIFSGSVGQSSSQSANSFRLAASNRPETRRLRVLGHLENYCHRELSYSADMLDAFRGILSAHEVRDVFGLVLPRPLIPGRGQFIANADTNLDLLCEALVSWWHSSATAIRIPEFPSWSWAGWRGDLTTRTPPEDPKYTLKSGRGSNYYQTYLYGPYMKIHYDPRHLSSAGIRKTDLPYWTFVPKERFVLRGPEMMLSSHRKLLPRAVVGPNGRSGSLTFGDVHSPEAKLTLETHLSCPVQQDAVIGGHVDFVLAGAASHGKHWIFLVVRYIESEPPWKDAPVRVCERIGLATLKGVGWIDGATNLLFGGLCIV